MASLSAALQQAGYNKNDMELGAAALKYFNAGGTLARYQQIGEKIAAKRRPSHSSIDSQGDAARQSGGGQAADDPQATNAASAQPSPAPRPPHKGPSAAQKQAALQAKKDMAAKLDFLDTYKIDGRALGEIKVRELRAIALNDADKAVSWLGRGATAAVRAIGSHLLLTRGVPSSDDIAVREFIKPKQAEKIFTQAAPKIFAEWVRAATKREAHELLVASMQGHQLEV